MGTASVSREHSGRGVALTTHFHLAPRLKKECRYKSIPCVGLRGLLCGELLVITMYAVTLQMKNRPCTCRENFEFNTNEKCIYYLSEDRSRPYGCNGCRIWGWSCVRMWSRFELYRKKVINLQLPYIPSDLLNFEYFIIQYGAMYPWSTNCVYHIFKYPFPALQEILKFSCTKTNLLMLFGKGSAVYERTFFYGSTVQLGLAPPHCWDS
jgi:hypothetical protein